MRIRSLIVFALCLAAGGCGISMQLPKDFLRMSEQEVHDLRAVTADGAQLWVRDFAVQKGADVGFWTTALVDDLRRARGYEVEEPTGIRDGRGRVGRQIVAHDVLRGEPVGWFAAVFLLDDDELRIAEFAAREDVFAAHLEAVRGAIATLR